MQGLNEEMYDTAVAFTEWCNEHGGILGRELVLVGRRRQALRVRAGRHRGVRARLRAGRRRRGVRRGPQRRPGRAATCPTSPATSCRRAAAPPTSRCSRSRTRSTTSRMGRYNAAARDFPDGIDKYGIMAAAIPSVLLVKQQSIEVAEAQGLRGRLLVRLPEPGRDGLGELRAGDEGQGHQDPRVHRPAAEPHRAHRRDGDRRLAPRGDPAEHQLLRRALPRGCRRPTATSTSSRPSTRSSWPTRTRPRRTTSTSWSSTTRTGRSPSSGMQGLSSWLLFAKAATACGSELTAECLLEEAAAPDGLDRRRAARRPDPGQRASPARAS